MTKEDCKKKIEEMSLNFRISLLAKSESLMKSGAIDFDAWEDGYSLPRIIMVAAAHEVIDNYSFPYEAKEVQNLRRF